MAQEAHKEPTMEEILASIRKIISEDDTPSARTDAPVESPARLEAADIAVTDEPFDVSPEAEDIADDETSAENGNTLSFEDLIATAAAADKDTPSARVGDANAEIEATPEPVFDTEPFHAEEFEEMDFETEPEPEPAFNGAAASDTTFEAVAEDDDLPPPPLAEPERHSAEQSAAFAPDTDPEPQAQAEELPPMAQTARNTSLTEDATADAAAGALARLVSKMDMGSENTLEGIVRELLKPMLKEWLDQNLPQIVEEKVEAEVQRIARLAR